MMPDEVPMPLASNSSPAVFTVKAYSPDGSVARRTYGPNLMLGVLTVTRAVNSLSGQLTLELALPYDESGYGTDLNPHDRWDVYAVTSEYPLGTLVFRGFVEEANPVISSDGQDHTTVVLYPVEEGLNFTWKHDGNYSFTFTSASIESIVSVLIDDLNADFPSSSPALLIAKDLGTTGVTTTVTFDGVSYSDAIDTLVKKLDSTWYWLVTPDGTFTLAQWPTSATSTLTAKRDADTISPVFSLVDTYNVVRVKWSGGEVEESDAASISAYGKRTMPTIDMSSSLSSGSDASGYAVAQLTKSKDVKAKVTVKANRRAALESLLPGGTLAVMNQNLALPALLKIAQVSYDGATASVQCEETTYNLGAETTKLIQSSK